MDPSPQRAAAPLAAVLPVQPPEAKPPAGESAIEQALRCARGGQLARARDLLGIDEQQLSDPTLVDGLMAFDEAMGLAAQKRLHEAAPALARARAVSDVTRDDFSRSFVELLHNVASGLASLFANDPLTAHRLLDLSAETINRLSFFHPELKTLALSAKANSHTAMARHHLSAGDVQQARVYLGRADAIYQQLHETLDPQTSEGREAALTLSAVRLEETLTFARLDMEVLDCASMRERLANARAAFEFVREHLASAPRDGTTDVLGLMCGLYSVMVRTQTLLETRLVARRPLEQDDIKALQAMRVELQQLHERALTANERGKGYLYPINQLSRLHQSLLQLGKVSRSDFGRLGGLIALAALVVLLLAIHFTVRPEGWIAFLYFVGAVMIALIVGFGYGALRFRPLLKQWTDLARREKLGNSTST